MATPDMLDRCSCFVPQNRRFVKGVQSGTFGPPNQRKPWGNSNIVCSVALRDIARFMGSSRRQYPFHLIEPKWQRLWDRSQTFRAWNPGETVPPEHPSTTRHGVVKPEFIPKFYILD